MARYIIRRILWGVVLLVLVSALTFVIFDIFPTANPAQLRAGRNASPAIIHHIEIELGLNHSGLIKAIEHQLGLDKPWYAQYFDYMKQVVLHFNFGYSFQSQQSVLSLIVNRLPATLSLTVGAVILWVVAGIPVGIISAIKRGSIWDRTAMGVALGTSSNRPRSVTLPLD